MVAFEVLVLVVLVLQPLMFALWFALGCRWVAKKTGRGASRWVDHRVEKVTEEVGLDE